MAPMAPQGKKTPTKEGGHPVVIKKKRKKKQMAEVVIGDLTVTYVRTAALRKAFGQSKNPVLARLSSIRNAIAQAVMPYHEFDPATWVAAMEFLGQDAASLTCVYCGVSEPSGLDHLDALVVRYRPNGRGHQVGNLVPCCVDCNSSRGNKAFALFVAESPRIRGDRAALAELLTSYQAAFSVEIDWTPLEPFFDEVDRMVEDQLVPLLVLLDSMCAPRAVALPLPVLGGDR